MRRVLAIFSAVLVAGACAPSTTTLAPPKTPIAPRKEGAILLASPGHATVAYTVPGAPREIVRGRVRWHLESDGTATRLRTVTREPTNIALTLPTWLGNGMVLVSEGGVTAVDESGNVRALLRGAITAPSVGAHELWARARNVTSPDWVRIDVTSGKATWSLPPISAPVLPTWTSSGTGPLAGRAITAGPEYLSPKVAFALVDLLGPITTHDGGDNWGPLSREAIDAAFPHVGGPTRLVRDPTGVMLSDELRLVPVSPTGQLGTPTMLAKSRETAPEIASIHLETALLQGVPLEGGNILVANAGRFAIVSPDPMRVLRVTHAIDLDDCELRAEPATKGALAIAVCSRHEEEPVAKGAQNVVGVVLDGPSGLHFVPERVFPPQTGYRFSADGALIVAAPCIGTEQGSPDVTFATKACVRGAGGKFHDLALGGLAGRIAIAPRLDGGVMLVRIVAGMMELVALPPDATPTTVPLRLSIDAEAVPLHRSLVTCVPARPGSPAQMCFDELSPGKLLLWRRVEKALEPLTIELTADKLRVRRAPSLPVAGAAFGVYGDRALVVTTTTPKPGKGDVPRLDLVKLTTDGGASWARADWPEEALPLDGAANGVECGALGCRVFGWSRFGWQRAVASVDEVVSLDAAPELPPPPPDPPRATTAIAHCKRLTAPSPFDPTKVPVDHPTPASGKLVGVVGPEPKMAPGQVLQTLPFRGAANGGLFVWGPGNGAWSELSRMFLRFTSDLDPLGTTHETTPIATPFSDRNAVLRVAGGTHVYALGPDRAFVALCEYSHCDNLFFRAVAGMPLERIDLSAVGAITSIGNARELGGVLFVVGKAIPREKIVPVAKLMPEEQPFVALVSANGTVTSSLARSEPDVAATIDPVHGRFGVAVSSKLPTWLGGTTYVLPIEANGLPSGAFERLVAASTPIAQPSSACGAASTGWDRGEQNLSRIVRIEIDGEPAVTLASDAAAIRERITASGACLDRYTQLAAHDAFELDGSTGHGTLLLLSDDRKSAKKTELSCTLEWSSSL